MIIYQGVLIVKNLHSETSECFVYDSVMNQVAAKHYHGAGTSYNRQLRRRSKFHSYEFLQFSSVNIRPTFDDEWRDGPIYTFETRHPIFGCHWKESSKPGIRSVFSVLHLEVTGGISTFRNLYRSTIFCNGCS